MATCTVSISNCGNYIVEKKGDGHVYVNDIRILPWNKDDNQRECKDAYDMTLALGLSERDARYKAGMTFTSPQVKIGSALEMEIIDTVVLRVLNGLETPDILLDDEEMIIEGKIYGLPFIGSDMLDFDAYTFLGSVLDARSLKPFMRRSSGEYDL